MIESSLAAWRLAHMFVYEDGPWAVFARLRYAVGIRKVPIRVGTELKSAIVARSTLAQGLTCLACVSVWSAALMIWVPPLRRLLAISGGAMLVQSIIENADAESR